MSERVCESILIVEDEPTIRENFRMLLELEGYQVLTASNGSEALQALKSRPYPGLVMLDLLMPVMNGAEFLEAKSRDKAIADIPVCIVSGVAEKPDLSKVSAFVKKPVDFDELLKIVARFCGDPKAKR